MAVVSTDPFESSALSPLGFCRFSHTYFVYITTYDRRDLIDLPRTELCSGTRVSTIFYKTKKFITFEITSASEDSDCSRNELRVTMYELRKFSSYFVSRTSYFDP